MFNRWGWLSRQAWHLFALPSADKGSSDPTEGPQQAQTQPTPSPQYGGQYLGPSQQYPAGAQQPSPQFPSQPPPPVGSYAPQGSYGPAQPYNNAQQLQQLQQQPYTATQAMQQQMMQPQHLLQLQQQQQTLQQSVIGVQGVGESAVDGLPRSSSCGNVQTGQLIQIDDDVVDSAAVNAEKSNSREISPPTNAGEEVFKRPTLPKAPSSSSHNQKVDFSALPKSGPTPPPLPHPFSQTLGLFLSDLRTVLHTGKREAACFAPAPEVLPAEPDCSHVLVRPWDSSSHRQKGGWCLGPHPQSHPHRARLAVFLSDLEILLPIDRREAAVLVSPRVTPHSQAVCLFLPDVKSPHVTKRFAYVVASP